MVGVSFTAPRIAYGKLIGATECKLSNTVNNNKASRTALERALRLHAFDTRFPFGKVARELFSVKYGHPIPSFN